MERSPELLSDDESTAWSMSLQRFNVSRILSSPQMSPHLSPISTATRSSDEQASPRPAPHKPAPPAAPPSPRSTVAAVRRAGGPWAAPGASALSLSFVSVDSDVWREVESEDEQEELPPHNHHPPHHRRHHHLQLFRTVESDPESDDEAHAPPAVSPWSSARRAGWATDDEDWAAAEHDARARRARLRGLSSDRWGAQPSSSEAESESAPSGMFARRVLSVPAGRTCRRLPRPKAFIVLKQKAAEKHAELRKERSDQALGSYDPEDEGGICLRRSISAQIPHGPTPRLSAFAVKYSCDEVRRGKVEFLQDARTRLNLRKCSSIGGIGLRRPNTGPKRSNTGPKRPNTRPKRPPFYANRPSGNQWRSPPNQKRSPPNQKRSPPSQKRSPPNQKRSSPNSKVIPSSDEFLDFMKAAAEKRRRRLRKRMAMRRRILNKASELWRILRAVPKTRKRNWGDARISGSQGPNYWNRGSAFARV